MCCFHCLFLQARELSPSGPHGHLSNLPTHCPPLYVGVEAASADSFGIKLLKFNHLCMSPFESKSLVHETLKLPTEGQWNNNVNYQRHMSLKNVRSEEDNIDQQISNIKSDNLYESLQWTDGELGHTV